jgi:hypothetical protein
MGIFSECSPNESKNGNIKKAAKREKHEKEEEEEAQMH